VPSALSIPTPLFPTKERALIELYVLAVTEADIHKAKSLDLKQNNVELKQKYKDVKKFFGMSACVHNNNTPECDAYSKGAVVMLPIGFKKEFEELFSKLEGEMKIEGLIQLGRQVQTRLRFSGCSLKTLIANGCEGY
jgi:hypothetical protein